MTSKNKFYLFGLGIIIIFLVVLVVVKNLYFSPQKVINNDQIGVIAPPAKTATSTKEVLTNAKGQKWILPATADFTVSTPPGAPITFLEGKIEPLKVHPGDTQNMRLVIMSTSGLSGVRADIETDNGTTTVELKKTGTLAVKDLDPRLATYIIDAQNKLQILSPAEAAVYRQKEITTEASSSSGINSALAATGGREVWEGSWLVKDTSVRTYHTVFTATDTAGNKDSLILAWSDPCSPVWPVSGTVTTTNCSLSSTAGVDTGNLIIPNSVTLTLAGNLYFNQTQNISIPTNANPNALGKIVMAGGSFSKAYVYYLDKDQDGYANDSGGGLPSVVVSTTNSGDSTTGYAVINGDNARRGYKMTNNPYSVVDCNDTASGVYQNLTGYLDYDTDGYGTGSAYQRCSGASLSAPYVSNNTDCNDANQYAWRNITSAIDADHDGRPISTTGSANCVGAASGSYYKDDASNYKYLAGTSWAAVDCNDASVTVWQNLTGYLDSDSDGYGAGSASQVCSGASLLAGYASNNSDCYDGNANVKPSQVNWWSSAGSGWTPAGDYNCSGIAQYAWAHNSSYTNYTPAQTTENATNDWTVACSQYTGTQYTASACGTAIGYSGSIFVIASGATYHTCDAARTASNLIYWTAGPLISVCK